jgi:hypothetical protein
MMPFQDRRKEAPNSIRPGKMRRRPVPTHLAYKRNAYWDGNFRAPGSASRLELTRAWLLIHPPARR